MGGVVYARLESYPSSVWANAKSSRTGGGRRVARVRKGATGGRILDGEQTQGAWSQGAPLPARERRDP